MDYFFLFILSAFTLLVLSAFRRRSFDNATKESCDEYQRSMVVDDKPFSSNQNLTSRILRAFPSSMNMSVLNVLQKIPSTYPRPQELNEPGVGSDFLQPAFLSEDAISVKIGGETIEIPSRIYVSEPSDLDIRDLSEEEKAVLYCIYMRHYDGFVREKYTKMALPISRAWVAPFVIGLVGEYVFQINMFLLAQIEHLKTPVYSSFAAENKPFIKTLRKRIVSYWACYHRNTSFSNNPGYKLFLELGWWNTREGRRLVKQRPHQPVTFNFLKYP